MKKSILIVTLLLLLCSCRDEKKTEEVNGSENIKEESQAIENTEIEAEESSDKEEAVVEEALMDDSKTIQHYGYMVTFSPDGKIVKLEIDGKKIVDHPLFEANIYGADIRVTVDFISDDNRVIFIDRDTFEFVILDSSGVETERIVVPEELLVDIKADESLSGQHWGALVNGLTIESGNRFAYYSFDSMNEPPTITDSYGVAYSNAYPGAYYTLENHYIFNEETKMFEIEYSYDGYIYGELWIDRAFVYEGNFYYENQSEYNPDNRFRYTISDEMKADSRFKTTLELPEIDSLGNDPENEFQYCIESNSHNIIKLDYWAYIGQLSEGEFKAIESLSSRHFSKIHVREYDVDDEAIVYTGYTGYYDEEAYDEANGYYYSFDTKEEIIFYEDSFVNDLVKVDNKIITITNQKDLTEYIVKQDGSISINSEENLEVLLSEEHEYPYEFNLIDNNEYYVAYNDLNMIMIVFHKDKGMVDSYEGTHPVFGTGNTLVFEGDRSFVAVDLDTQESSIIPNEGRASIFYSYDGIVVINTLIDGGNLEILHY